MVAMRQLSPFLRGRIAHDVTALGTMDRYVEQGAEKEAIAAVQKKDVPAIGQEGETGETVAPGELVKGRTECTNCSFVVPQK